MRKYHKVLHRDANLPGASQLGPWPSWGLGVSPAGGSRGCHTLAVCQAMNIQCCKEGQSDPCCGRFDPEYSTPRHLPQPDCTTQMQCRCRAVNVASCNAAFHPSSCSYCALSRASNLQIAPRRQGAARVLMALEEKTVLSHCVAHWHMGTIDYLGATSRNVNVKKDGTV